VTQSAPRIPQRLLVAIDRHARASEVPLAEIARRVCADAERMGLARPSYERIRQLVHESRSIRRQPSRRRKGLQMLANDVMSGTLTRATVDELLAPSGD
jgi:hypothetical protein